MTALTIRRQIILLLQHEALGPRDLSQALGLPEKEIYSHLTHIAKTARRLGLRLEADRPAVCLSCGYAFRDRQRLTPPGRCPRCRATHISDTLFRLIPN